MTVFTTRGDDLVFQSGQGTLASAVFFRRSPPIPKSKRWRAGHHHLPRRLRPRRIDVNFFRVRTGP